MGDSAAVVIDGRQASWTIGTNEAIGAAWLVLDSFVDGNTVTP